MEYGINKLMELEKERKAYYDKFDEFAANKEELAMAFKQEHQLLNVDDAKSLVDNGGVVYSFVGNLLYIIVKENEAYVEYFVNDKGETFECDNTSNYKSNRLDYLDDFDKFVENGFYK